MLQGVLHARNRWTLLSSASLQIQLSYRWLPETIFLGAPHSLLRQQLRFCDTGKEAEFDWKVMAVDFGKAG